MDNLGYGHPVAYLSWLVQLRSLMPHYGTELLQSVLQEPSIILLENHMRILTNT
jgi:hypothetical protein